jgi:predicted MFS family arabinose efflux permease
VYGLGAIAGSWLGGWLSDRIGATRTQQGSLIAGGFAFLWLSVLDGVYGITAAVLVLSILVEAFRPAVMADVSQRAPEEIRVRAFALLRLAANLGMGIGPAVGGYLALRSYRWLFVADAITCWLACLLLILMLDPVRGERPGKRSATKDTSPWSDGPFLLLMSLVVVMAAALFQVWITLPVYFRDGYGFREDTIGLLLALNPIIIVLFEMLLIRWAERLPRLQLVGPGCFLMCAGMALMPLGRSFGFAAFTIAIWTVGEMLALPLTSAVVADRATPESRGRYMGLYSMAFSIAFVFAPAGGTIIYDTLGPTWLWYGIGLVGFVLWGWALALIRPLRKPRGQT